MKSIGTGRKREERRLAMAQVITPVKEAYQMAANLFNARVEELEREGLKLYLKRRLRDLKIEKFNIAKKYGVRTSEEMERFYREKKLSEKDSWEDFFELDHIEAEAEEINEALRML